AVSRQPGERGSVPGRADRQASRRSAASVEPSTPRMRRTPAARASCQVLARDLAPGHGGRQIEALDVRQMQRLSLLGAGSCEAVQPPLRATRSRGIDVLPLALKPANGL